ncbi:NADH-quinone oxidoreductase subunit NuoN [Enemella sp. A6]|uniref:NADH-quinone oxidoreductase subunit NuoN n=1 Tax=Enemella sp. A6 TaxID=3440152 RepID=UPI003EBBCB58
MSVNMDALALPLLLPIILIFAVASVQVLIEALVPRHLRHAIQLGTTYAALAAALVLTVLDWRSGPHPIAGMNMISVDGPTHFAWVMLLIFAALALLTFAERRLYGGVSVFAPQAAAVPGTVQEREAHEARVEHTEVYPLALFALSGMMLFVSANNLLLLFVALEVMSLPLYLLSGLARRRRLLSQEAALKYFMLGALSSAFFLMGVALLFGVSGSFNLGRINYAIAGVRPPELSQDEAQAWLEQIAGVSPVLMYVGLALLAVGMLFKLGAVPFHQWTPDVYTGAPTPVTGFMAVLTKLAAVVAMMRVFYVALGAARWDWQLLLSVIAILTMAIGAVLAIVQTDVKRMLAYSAINHAGYLLVALVAASQAATGVGEGQLTSVSSVLFYMLTYGFATLAAFAAITLVRDPSGEVTDINGWSGLSRKSPLLAAAMALMMLSFAGIPLTAGFMGKWMVFASGVRGGFAWLVVIGVLMSLVAAFFYLRLIVVMYFRKPVEGPEVVTPGVGTMIVLLVGVVATVLLGVFPGPAMELAQQAAEFLG